MHHCSQPSFWTQIFDHHFSKSRQTCSMIQIQTVGRHVLSTHSLIAALSGNKSLLHSKEMMSPKTDPVEAVNSRWTSSDRRWLKITNSKRLPVFNAWFAVAYTTLALHIVSIRRSLICHVVSCSIVHWRYIKPRMHFTKREVTSRVATPHLDVTRSWHWTHRR